MWKQKQLFTLFCIDLGITTSISTALVVLDIIIRPQKLKICYYLDENDRNLGVNEILSDTDKKLLGSVHKMTYLHYPQHVSFHFQFELSRYLLYNLIY